MDLTRCTAVLMVFLAGVAIGYSEQQPVFSIDLRDYSGQLGRCYNPPTTARKWPNVTEETNKPIIRLQFWGQYLIVDTSPRPIMAYDKVRQAMVATNDLTPCPRLVFDVTTGKAVSAEIVKNEFLEPQPWAKPCATTHPECRRHSTMSSPPLQDEPEDAVHEMDRWKDMRIVTIGSGADLYLEQAGRERVLVYKAPKNEARENCLPGAMFLGADHIGIKECSPNPRRSDQMTVVDKAGRKRYAMKRYLTRRYVMPDAANTVLNGKGTRFAVYETSSAHFYDVMNSLANRNTLWIGVTVLSADTGKKIVQYHWSGENEESLHDLGRLALSDDGLLLAVIKDPMVVLFPVPADSK